MKDRSAQRFRWTRTVLHADFALTGVVHAIGGPLLPSLNRTYHLTDSEAGLLFLAYFGGSSLGALFCRGNYTRVMAAGLAGMGIFSLAVSVATRPLLLPIFFMLGICVGAAMSAVSLFAGRNFPDTSASLLTILNFTWSAGALAAPMLASGVLRHSSYRTAYLGIAAASCLAALASWIWLDDIEEVPGAHAVSDPLGNWKFVVIFALMAFLQVGVENTASVWLTTYVLRVGRAGVALSAAASSLFWFGFLASRALSAVLLVRTRPEWMLRVCIVSGLGAALLLLASHQLLVASIAMLFLGAALAPIYPLVVAASMARLRQTSDARYVLAIAGIGGSILPWMAGWISALTHTIRAGMAILPFSILLMLLCLHSVHEPAKARRRFA